LNERVLRVAFILPQNEFSGRLPVEKLSYLKKNLRLLAYSASPFPGRKIMSTSKISGFSAVIAKDIVAQSLALHVTDSAKLKQLQVFSEAGSATFNTFLSPEALTNLNAYAALIGITDPSTVQKILFWVLVAFTFGVLYFIVKSQVSGRLTSDDAKKKIEAAAPVAICVGGMILFEKLLGTYFEIGTAATPTPTPAPVSPPAPDRGGDMAFGPADAGGMTMAAAPAKAAGPKAADGGGADAKVDILAPAPANVPAKGTSVLAALIASDRFSKALADSDVVTPTALKTALESRGVSVQLKKDAPTEFLQEHKDGLADLVKWSVLAVPYVLERKNIATATEAAEVALRKIAIGGLMNGDLIDPAKSVFAGAALMGAEKFDGSTELAKAVAAASAFAGDGAGSDVSDASFKKILDKCVADAVEAVREGVKINERTPAAISQNVTNDAVLAQLNAFLGSGLSLVLRTSVEGGDLLSEGNRALLGKTIAALYDFMDKIITAIWAAVEADEGYTRAVAAAKVKPDGDYKTAFETTKTSLDAFKKAEIALFPPVAAANPTPTPTPADPKKGEAK
jgi:hypothetical protein